MGKDNTANLGKHAKTGGPGRPKGSVGGRRKMLQALDNFLNQEGREQEMLEAWATYWADGYYNPKTEKALPGPVKFWLDLIQPNLPKDIDLDIKGGFPSTETFEAFIRAKQAEAAEKAGVKPEGESG